jgi:uncharacterized OB-fold protein
MKAKARKTAKGKAGSKVAKEAKAKGRARVAGKKPPASKAPTKKKPAKAAPAAAKGRVRLNTKPSEIDKGKGVWVLHVPRFGKEGEHFHTYGLLTPYFEGLTKGKLMATRCVNPKCPVGKGRGESWLPPRADCPDCHHPMVWEQVRDPRGYIYTFTKVERGGTGLEIETPYYQVDVKIPGVATIVKSWLLDRKPIKIGDRVRAVFRKGPEATHTCLDLCFELE